jgi:hypothetical protein
MNAAALRWRSVLWWLLPSLAVAVLLGFEIDWGRRMHRLPAPPPAIEARPVTLALLPEYKVEGGLASHAETVNRTLFNPTRRPAPALAVDSGRKQLQRGQFLLTGTTVAGDRSIAFLKEVAGGKSRTVRQGEQINGIMVAEVKPDRVRLTLGDESEELVLKVAPGPRVTAPAPQPPVAAAPAQAVPTVNATPKAVQAPTNSGAGQALEQRRRAGRNAAGGGDAAAQPAPAVPPAFSGAATPTTPAAAPSTGAPASADPAWNDVYERMRQRVGAQPTK